MSKCNRCKYHAENSGCFRKRCQNCKLYGERGCACVDIVENDEVDNCQYFEEEDDDATD